MYISKFRSRLTHKLQTLNGYLCVTQLNSRYSQSNHIHGDFSNKKPKREKLHSSIPFIDHLKDCKNPEDFLSTFHQFLETGYKHDYPSYACIIYKLAKAKKFEEIDSLLHILKKHNIKCDEALFIGLIRHYGKEGLIDKAVELFREMGRSFNCRRTVQSFNTILNVLVDNKRDDDAVELFKKGAKMRFKFNSISFNVMIKMWLDKGDWEKATQVFDEMLEREVQPTAVTYNCQIGFLCKRGDVDGAKRLFGDMVKKGKKRNAVTYALLMEGLCSLGKFKEAKKLMFDMEYQGCKVELVNYGVLMTDLANNGLMDEAKALLTEMKKRRIKPDAVMYNIMINWFTKEGSVSEAYKLLVDMQVKGCEPNAASYRMVLDGFCRIGDFQGGLTVFNVMLYSKHLPRIETLYSLFTGLVMNWKLDDAGFVLEEMEKRNMRLNLESWENLVKEFCLDDDEVVIRYLTDIVLVNTKTS